MTRTLLAAAALACGVAAVPAIRATLAADGTATVVYVDPVESPTSPPQISGRLVAVDGR